MPIDMATLYAQYPPWRGWSLTTITGCPRAPRGSASPQGRCRAEIGVFTECSRVPHRTDRTAEFYLVDAWDVEEPRRGNPARRTVVGLRRSRELTYEAARCAAMPARAGIRSSPPAASTGSPADRTQPRLGLPGHHPPLRGHHEGTGCAVLRGSPRRHHRRGRRLGGRPQPRHGGPVAIRDFTRTHLGDLLPRRRTVHPEDGPLKVAIAIVAHKDRAKQVDRLVDWVDPDYVSWDDGTLGPAENHLRAWETSPKKTQRFVWSWKMTQSQWRTFGANYPGFWRSPRPIWCRCIWAKGDLPTGNPRWPKSSGSLDRRLYPNAPGPVLADRRRGTARRGAGDETLPDRRHAPGGSALHPTPPPTSPPRRREAIGAWARSAGIRCPIVFRQSFSTATCRHRSPSTPPDTGDTGIRDQPRRAWAMGTRRRWDGTSVEAPAPSLSPAPSAA